MKKIMASPLRKRAQIGNWGLNRFSLGTTRKYKGAMKNPIFCQET